MNTFSQTIKKVKKWFSFLEKKELSWLDCAIVIALAVVGFLFFTQNDIIVTGERSFLLLKGNIVDFYSAAEKLTDGGANYLPTTFILFAIWNLPLKLLGLAPASFGQSGLIQIMWYKLLPACVYILTVFVVYQLVHKKFKADIIQAKIITFSYASFPIAMFSQFIFCQYDIFTVCFMLLGLWYYFEEEQTRKSKFLFCLYFALAVTCKYQVAVIYMILVVLRKKEILRILKYCVAGFSIAILQVLFYRIADWAAFKNQVIKFSVLDYAKQTQLNFGLSSISFLFLALCILLAWAYFTDVTERERLIDYVLFFGCGACFAFFGLMKWHPQWLMLGAFFWTVSECRNKKYNFFNNNWLKFLF